MRKLSRNKVMIQSLAEFHMLAVENSVPDPIGTAHTDLEDVNTYLETLKAEWDKIRGKVSPWQFWKKTVGGMHKATRFLLQSVDGLVMLVDDLVDIGPDKKATVLHALNMLYDYVVREAIPLYMRPFAGKIKDYVIYTLASAAIDWIVMKYNEGSWRLPEAEATS